MGHNSVVSGHPKFTGIPRVDWLSTSPLDLGRHRNSNSKESFGENCVRKRESIKRINLNM